MIAHVKQYLMLLRRCFDGSEVENYHIQLLFTLKIKTNKNRVLSINKIVLVAHVALVKLNLMQKLYGMNIMIQLIVQNH